MLVANLIFCRGLDLKEKIENFPYRNSYGDDELFTRDVLWVMMKYIGSVMTHVYKKDYILKHMRVYWSGISTLLAPKYV